MPKASPAAPVATKSRQPARNPVDDFLEFLARQIAREHLRRHVASAPSKPNEAASKRLATEGEDAHQS